MNPDVDPDIPAMLGASAALAVSGVPFNGPIGAVRVGYVDGDYIFNPGISQLDNSKLNLVVAGTKNAVLMVESEADILSEEVMLGAVMFGHEHLQSAIQAIEEFADEVGNPAWDWQASEEDESLALQVDAACREQLTQAYQVAEKQARQEQVSQARESLLASLVNDEEGPSAADVPRCLW